MVYQEWWIVKPLLLCPSPTFSVCQHNTILVHPHSRVPFFRAIASKRKTLKSGCLSLLTIRSFSARDGLGLSVRVWLGFGLGLSVRAIDSLTDTV